MQTQETSAKQGAMLSDATLVQRTIAGDQQAFDVLVHRYNSQLYYFIYRFIGDYDQTCDIVQEVFLQLYLSLPTLCVKKPLKSWLLRVAHHRSVDELRRKYRRSMVYLSELEMSAEEDENTWLSALTDSSPLPDQLAEQHDLQRRLLQAIQTLPPKYRSIVYLRYAGQMNYAEIGGVLQIPEATAKTYFQRAKPQLRMNLEDEQ